MRAARAAVIQELTGRSPIDFTIYSWGETIGLLLIYLNFLYALWLWEIGYYIYCIKTVMNEVNYLASAFFRLLFSIGGICFGPSELSLRG